MKQNYSISKQFQDDLIKAYNSVARTCWRQSDAYKKAVKLPAPRFYVSARQAAQVIAPMLRGDFERVNMMFPNKRRMYYALFEKVIELSEKRTFVGKPLTFITQFAVTSPAPEFFTSPFSLKQIRVFLHRGKLDFDGKVVNHDAREKAYERLKAKRKALKEYRAQFKEQTEAPRQSSC